MKRFNPEKELKKIQYGNKNKVLYGIILLLLVISIGSSYALYQVRYSKRIIYTKVAPFSNRDLDIAIYVDGVKQNEIPSKDDGYTYVNIECDKGIPMASWDEDSYQLMSYISIPNKCNVYFISDNYIETFEYTGKGQEYIVPKDGIYKIELWGASGGDEVALGGYTKGEIELSQGETLFIYVGGKGNPVPPTYQDGNTAGGYNGGGNTSKGPQAQSGPTGGGATDVRLESNGSWNDFESLKSRIMVAAGGAGSIKSNYATVGSAGGLNGYDSYSEQDINHGRGASQISGGAAGVISACMPYSNRTDGSFGQGGIGGANGNNTTFPHGGGSGGGGGYYGGGGGTGICNGTVNGGGGSSFISGHKGCDAIDNENSTDINNIIHTHQPNHYSNKIFAKTLMIDGMGYYWTDSRQTYIGMPAHDGRSIMTGNSGDGYAKITYLGPA